jgi:hypothetical protein
MELERAHLAERQPHHSRLLRLIVGILIASGGVAANELLIASTGTHRPDWAWGVSIGLLCLGAFVSGSWWALFLDPPAFAAGLAGVDLWLSETGRHARGWDLFDGDTLTQSLSGHSHLVIGLTLTTIASVALGRWLFRSARPT